MLEDNARSALGKRTSLRLRRSVPWLLVGGAISGAILGVLAQLLFSVGTGTTNAASAIFAVYYTAVFVWAGVLSGAGSLLVFWSYGGQPVAFWRLWLGAIVGSTIGSGIGLSLLLGPSTEYDATATIWVSGVIIGSILATLIRLPTVSTTTTEWKQSTNLEVNTAASDLQSGPPRGANAARNTPPLVAGVAAAIGLVVVLGLGCVLWVTPILFNGTSVNGNLHLYSSNHQAQLLGEFIVVIALTIGFALFQWITARSSKGRTGGTGLVLRRVVQIAALTIGWGLVQFAWIFGTVVDAQTQAFPREYPATLGTASFLLSGVGWVLLIVGLVVEIVGLVRRGRERRVSI